MLSRLSLARRLGATRGFRNWVPGRVYSPIPLKYVDLHEVYRTTLAEFVDSHLPALARHFGVHPVAAIVLNRLMDFSYPELDRVKAARAQHPKQIMLSSATYNALLTSLYSREPRVTAVLAALASFPGAEDHRQAAFIEADHLETLINFSMDKSRLCVEVFRMLETARLPTTAREKAQYVYQSYRLARGDVPGSPGWRAELARHWPDILAAKDANAFNTLLKLALRARCRDTQNLVEYHLQTPNRFTFGTKLRAASVAAPEILRGIEKHHVVMDTIMFSSFLSKMVRSGNPALVSQAEHRFERLLAASRGIRPGVDSANRLALQLRAMDRANQIVAAAGPGSGGIQLPLMVDAVLLRRMYGHYINMRKHAAALNVAVAMAQQGVVLPRHLLYSHMHSKHTPLDTLEQLFYLCCDVNTVHPRFISPSLASAWTSLIADRGAMARDEAEELVSRSRAPLTM